MPSLTVVNSSALKVRLNSGTKLNPRDHWSAAQKYEIVCYEGSTLIRHFTNLAGAYPQIVTLSGLKNYTVYRCKAYYFGNINGSEYNFASGFAEGRTAENCSYVVHFIFISFSFHFHFIFISFSFHFHFIVIFHFIFISFLFSFHFHFVFISFSFHFHFIFIPFSFHFHSIFISFSFHYFHFHFIFL